MVSILLSFGANPNEPIAEAETPLHIAAFEGSEECVRSLLNAGANPNAKTIEGKTPLMNAAQSGNNKILNFLLRKNADPKAIDHFGRTALHWCAVGKHDDSTIVHILTNYGTDQNLRTINGKTARDYAEKMNKSKLLEAFKCLRR